MNRLQKLITGCVALVVCTTCSCGFSQLASPNEPDVPSPKVQITMGSATDWLEGKALEKARLLPVSVAWTESPLRDQLMQFGIQRRRPIFVDRRVDPTLKQTLQMFESTTDQVVWRTAAANDLGVARIGNLLYVGPKSSASRLPFLIAATEKNLSKLGKDVRRKWNRKSDILWPDATTTMEVASWFESNHRIKFRDPIPFDVWPASDWPKLTLLEQMSLVMVGFDLAVEIDKDGHTISLVNFPDIETGSKKFKTKDVTFEFDKAKTKFGGLRFAKSGSTVTVKGNVEQIAELDGWIVDQQKVVQGKEKTFDLNMENVRRGDILSSAVQLTGHELQLVGRANELLAQPINVNLEKATLESLIEVCLEGTGLKYTLSNSTLTISDK